MTDKSYLFLDGRTDPNIRKAALFEIPYFDCQKTNGENLNARKTQEKTIIYVLVLHLLYKSKKWSGTILKMHKRRLQNKEVFSKYFK